MINNRRALIVGIRSLKLNSNERIFLKKYKPWGVILFSRNIKSIKQTKNLNRAPPHLGLKLSSATDEQVHRNLLDASQLQNHEFRQ